MKYLWLMGLISKNTDWRIGIDHSKQTYYIVSSKTGERHSPWLGIITWFLMLIPLCGIIFAPMLATSILVEYGNFWLSALLYFVAYLSVKGIMILRDMFEVRPDTYDEDYEPSKEELEEWDNWVHWFQNIAALDRDVKISVKCCL